MAIAGLPRPADQSALQIARAACATGRRVSKTRARMLCSWLYCGRGAQRYAALKEAIEVRGETVSDEDLDWFNEMKAAKQKGFSDRHEVGCPPLSTHTRASRVSDSDSKSLG